LDIGDFPLGMIAAIIKAIFVPRADGVDIAGFVVSRFC
jgi:hypothetical protein